MKLIISHECVREWVLLWNWDSVCVMQCIWWQLQLWGERWFLFLLRHTRNRQTLTGVVWTVCECSVTQNCQQSRGELTLIGFTLPTNERTNELSLPWSLTIDKSAYTPLTSLSYDHTHTSHMSVHLFNTVRRAIDRETTFTTPHVCFLGGADFLTQQWAWFVPIRQLCKREIKQGEKFNR